MHDVRVERRRGFQPPWYSVLIYRCAETDIETVLRVNWRGPTPNGGFVANCGHVVSL